MSLTITVESTKEVDIILAGLRKLPMEDVEMVVYGIRMQVMQQMQAQAAQEEAHASEAVETHDEEAKED